MALRYSFDERPCGDRELQMGNLCGYHAIHNSLGICINSNKIPHLNEEYEKHIWKMLQLSRKYDLKNLQIASDEWLSWVDRRRNGMSRQYLFWILKRITPDYNYIVFKTRNSLENRYIPLMPLHLVNLRTIMHALLVSKACIICGHAHAMGAKKIHDQSWCVMDSEGDPGVKVSYEDFVEKFKTKKYRFGSVNISNYQFSKLIQAGLAHGDEYIFLYGNAPSTIEKSARPKLLNKRFQPPARTPTSQKKKRQGRKNRGRSRVQ